MCHIELDLKSNKKPELLIVEKGHMVFTPPLVEHCMKFDIDTLFLTLSRNARDQKTYEADTVRVDFINKENLQKMIEIYGKK